MVDSGDALTLGIGAMTDARWKSFAASMIQAGVYPPTIDLSKAYTLRFVNKKVGMELKYPVLPAPAPEPVVRLRRVTKRFAGRHRGARRARSRRGTGRAASPCSAPRAAARARRCA